MLILCWFVLFYADFMLVYTVLCWCYAVVYCFMLALCCFVLFYAGFMLFCTVLCWLYAGLYCFNACVYCFMLVLCWFVLFYADFMLVCTVLCWCYAVLYCFMLVLCCCVLFYAGFMLLCTVLCWFYAVLYYFMLVLCCFALFYPGFELFCTRVLPQGFALEEDCVWSEPSVAFRVGYADFSDTSPTGEGKLLLSLSFGCIYIPAIDRPLSDCSGPVGRWELHTGWDRLLFEAEHAGAGARPSRYTTNEPRDRGWHMPVGAGVNPSELWPLHWRRYGWSVYPIPAWPPAISVRYACLVS